MKNKQPQNQTKNPILPVITTVEHASFVMNWGGVIIYNDPVGEASLYASSPPPDIILLSDIHGDHFNLETLSTLVGENTKLIAPEAVAEPAPMAAAAEAAEAVPAATHEEAKVVTLAGGSPLFVRNPLKNRMVPRGFEPLLPT